jgi:site-specific recombinase XerD
MFYLREPALSRKHVTVDSGFVPLLAVGHDLRHTFASHLIIDLGLDVAQVSRILGHARASIALGTYTHLFDHATHAADIRDRMEASHSANSWWTGHGAELASARLG